MGAGVVVNTNISSIHAARVLSKNRSILETAMARLSSGKRLNSAADDAAATSVAAKMRADARSTDVAVRNINDGISMFQTFDGAASEVENILVRMRELAVQMKNGTYDVADRTAAQTEFEALQKEITRIAENTKFNRLEIANTNVRTADSAAGADVEFDEGDPVYVDADGDEVSTVDAVDDTFSVKARSASIHLGAAAADSVSFEFADLTAATLQVTYADDTNLDQLDAIRDPIATEIEISTAADAGTAVTRIDAALATVAEARATAGSNLNRLGFALSNAQNMSQRLKEALSGLEDADYAAESASLARGMVLAQAGTAMLAQANQAPQYVLALLRT